MSRVTEAGMEEGEGSRSSGVPGMTFEIGGESPDPGP